MDDHWTSLESRYSQDADYLDRSIGIAFHPSEARDMSSIQRFLHSDENPTLFSNAQTWDPVAKTMWSKPTVVHDYERFPLPSSWQAPIEYPTPPWSSPRHESFAIDQESISSGSLWSPRTSETYPERETSSARRTSPISDLSGNEPRHNMGLCSSFSVNSSCGGSNSFACIEPAAIHQYPEVEADTTTDVDADAEGDPEDFSADPLLQETAKAPYYDRSIGHAALKPTSVLTVPEDEGIASSIRGTSLHSHDAEDDDMEVDGECKDDDGSDYKPSKRMTTSNQRRTSRASKPKAPNSPRSARRGSNSLSKPAKITKQSSRNPALHANTLSPTLPRHQKSCTLCPQRFPSTSTLNKHILTAHTRPFICTFARYGCPATFGSKNEYKRHVSSQHLRPGIYRCDIGGCVPQPRAQRRKSSSASCSKEGEVEGYNEFNRKDLFTQHVRRMHGPSNSAPKAEKDHFESGLDDTRARCWIKLHDPPPRSVCGFCLHSSPGGQEGKVLVFEGSSGWEERMEHVGRHLEKGEQCEDEDTGLREWMVQEGLLDWIAAERRWRVVGVGRRRTGEEDAEGESE